MIAEKVQPKKSSGSSAAEAVKVQCSLAIGAVNAPLEAEADTMADKVMRMHEMPSVAATGAGGIQRKCAECEEEEKLQRKPLASFIQRKESSAGIVASDEVSNKINASKGRGSNMDSHTQSFMQSRFGTDFSDVKIHTGGESIQMNRELNAKAFTVGNDIYFNEGQYNPNSSEGKYLLAHELTHTVQQGGEVSLKGKDHNIQRKSSVNLIQRAVTATKQESYAGLFELSKHTPLGGPTFAPTAQYNVKIEFTPYQVVDCDQIAMTQTLISKLKGGLVAPSAEQTARQLAAVEGTTGVSIDRLSGKTSPLYGINNTGTAAGNAHFGNRTGNNAGDKAWMTDIPGFDGAMPASSRTAGDPLSQHLETCAICKAGKDKDTYYGCVNWGYDIDAADKFTEDSFTLVSKGTPSSDFLAAAKKWNDQTVPVATDDLPLPTHKTKQTSMTEAQLKTEITTLETTLKELAAGHVDIAQITFEIKVYKDILGAIANNKTQGYSQDDIKAIQAVVGSATNGTFDFDTILKIKRWQVEQNLKGDGRFGSISKKKFDDIVNAAVTANKGKGFTADQIKKIQVEVGSNDDGSWGSITVKHLMVWQKDHSLLVTGEFNLFTQISMFGIFGF